MQQPLGWLSKPTLWPTGDKYGETRSVRLHSMKLLTRQGNVRGQKAKQQLPRMEADQSAEEMLADTGVIHHRRHLSGTLHFCTQSYLKVDFEHFCMLVHMVSVFLMLCETGSRLEAPSSTS